MRKGLTFATFEHVKSFTYRWDNEVRLVCLRGRSTLGLTAERQEEDSGG